MILSYLNFRNTNSFEIFIRSITAALLPLTIYICLWVLVLRFYNEIVQIDRKTRKFAHHNRNLRTIENFMTEDEYNLSKQNLKVNARALKENDAITSYIHIWGDRK